MASSRYAAAIDLTNLNNAHTLGILSVPAGARVLDIGAADGSVARALRDRGCTVWAVELDADAAEAARRCCERVVQADVEDLDFGAEFGAVRFDAVLLLDVLEHLRDPRRVLRAVLPLLAENGRLVASIPNVAHADLRLHLLRGSFRYHDTGLLDRTHLRFYDRQSVLDLFASAGLRIVDDLRVFVPPGGTELGIDLDSFPDEVVREATSDREAETYQFVVVAVPAAAVLQTMPGADLPTLLQAQNRELERMVRDGTRYVEDLKAELDAWQRAAREAEAAAAERDERIAALESEVATRAEELAALGRDLRVLQLDLGVKEAYIVALRTDVAETRSIEEQRAELAAIAASHSEERRQHDVWVREIEAQLIAKNAHIRWLEGLLQRRVIGASPARRAARRLKRETATRLRRVPPAYWLGRKLYHALRPLPPR